jgi:hypothetical protein
LVYACQYASLGSLPTRRVHVEDKIVVCMDVEAKPPSGELCVGTLGHEFPSGADVPSDGLAR